MSEEEEVIIPSIEGLTKAEALTRLISVDGLDFKAAEDFWTANKPKRGVGFAARFYSILVKGILSEAEFDILLNKESSNVKNHRSHYNSIRETTNEIFANFAAAELEESEEEETDA